MPSIMDAFCPLHVQGVAVNHTLSNLNADAFEMTLRNRPKLVSFALGDPRDLVRRVHDVGSLAMLQVTTVRQARHAAERGVDAHPQAHVDVGIIVYNQPRPAFVRYLQAIVDAGFTKRRHVRNGSDGLAGHDRARDRRHRRSADPDGTAENRHLYNNAVRFLRLTKDDIARHHRR